MDPALIKTGSLFVAVLLLLAAFHKLHRLTDFKKVLAGYDLVPGPLLPLATVLVPFVEAVLGLGLVLPGIAPYAALGASGLFMAYGGMIGIALWRGRKAIDCGCSFGARPVRLSLWMLPRNLCLSVLALGPVFTAASRSLMALDYLNILAGVLFFGLVYLAVEGLLANRAYYLTHMLKKEHSHG
ncbi:MauE/DoxX family redox-associated membrane protein [Luteithermobacter gelatinilyticus]|uniref:MauE/DoxX family redox-associated membrane protein n=1 Tax=Luteithermobacter gelatinilyticus TaxID=2582913 RepID=UPI00143D81C1|nr:MauE/DoxX family redox-associated membrane protein [Luteithermobacter gelatinilyticus]